MTVHEATQLTTASRRLPIGAEPLDRNAGVHFRVWAPKRRQVEVVFEDGLDAVALGNENNSYFSGVAPQARPGARYKYRLDGGDAFPDPVSRFQPDGVHGPSQVVDPRTFQWSDDNWNGVDAANQVLYEMHIGTFTREGTWTAAERELQHLKDLGVTCLEIMPVNEFAGRWGWGYDGVQLFAPFHHYGAPDDMRRFIDCAHAIGLGVILDLVYNHLGPDGNYLGQFSDDYFSKTHHTDWGDALNFDGENSHGVREFFLANVRHWIEEYHLDGFRFDATQAILDDTPRHILMEITETARRSGGKRKIYLSNENEPQNTQLVRPIDGGGFGMDALWNDDFHHAALAALSGHNEAYYTDTRGTPQEFISSAKWGYLFQGQRYQWQKKRRGTPALDLPPTAFVHFLQNHDQIANSGRGYRLHQITSPGELKAMTALLLLMPQTPMLFQGQEFAASATFHYFANHNAELTKLICAGRAKELSQFPSVATPAMQSCLVDPGAEETFQRSKIDHAERERGVHKWMYDLHKDLLKLRRTESAFRRVQRRGDIDGAVLGPDAFVLRYFGADHDDRLVLVNLGRDIDLVPAPEPLLAPPLGMRWTTIFTSEDPKYGGSGTAPVDTEQEGWFIPGRTTVVLRPAPADRAAGESRFRVAGSAQDAK
ncbi:MAG: maltooligosyltrehalose trehalohydrolase, partial [Humisphaera sp.]|nr:maltooligosyltrehalose trehalohydrolase [Humisphaera sp.]